MTKKQRNELYRKAYQNAVDNGFDGMGICNQLAETGFAFVYQLAEETIHLNEAKEFVLFKPLQDFGWYFPCTNKTRLIILAFLIALTD